MGAKKIAETLTEADLVDEVSRVIMEITGVQLGQKQFALVQGRVAKRMRDLKCATPLDYARYYNGNEQIECGILISLLTTHHTFFFREFQHFEYLLNVSLPLIVKSHREKGQKTIRVWSAACSRGQEVYSLAMFLTHHLPQIAPEMSFEIFGSDVDAESVAVAQNGVYTWDELRVVPSIYLQNNWMRGTGEIAQYVRAKADLRKTTSFKVLNLVELGKGASPGFSKNEFDLIFCRNVFIYFSHAQIKLITSELLKSLSVSGHLFIGLSESLNGLGLPLEWIGPSVYERKRPGATKVVQLRPTPAAVSPRPSVSAPPQIVSSPPAVNRKLKVLCVDDSPTVLLLLKRILTSDRGFDIVGTAGDGIEAAEKARLLKPDVMTLDIHMPRMTGVEFLEKHFRELKIPVVVVSSVPRDDSSLAYRCLELGASDYIEKPSSQNLDKVEEELFFKLRVAEESWRQAHSGLTRSRAFELDASFKRPPTIMDPSGKLRILVANFASRDVVPVLLKGFQGPQPPTLVILEGAGEILVDYVAKTAAQLKGAKADEPKSIQDLKAGQISFIDFEKGLNLLRSQGFSFVISALVIGPLSRAMVNALGSISVNHMIIEDRGPDNPASLMSKARLIVPLTSFVYESDRFLAESDGRPKSGSGGRK